MATTTVEGTAAPAADYALGHSERELQRLRSQAEWLDGFTRRLLRDAGVGPGMKVLDVGTGAGDVALALAELVGPSGRVVGIDPSSAALDVARQRAGAAGHAHVAFVLGTADDAALEGDFDAVVGRLVLFHLRDPVAAVRRLAGRVKPGGLVAFQDYDIAAATCHPPSHLWQRTLACVVEAFRTMGADPRIGLKLRGIFLAAGLPEPELRCEASIGGAAGYAGYDQLAGVARSLLPVIVRAGLATEEELGVETLADRLREEVAARGGVGRGPDVISAWTRRR